MSDQEFNELLNGPLGHPLILFRISRLSLALRAVVDATGEAGEQALRDHCFDRAEDDAQNSAEE